MRLGSKTLLLIASSCLIAPWLMNMVLSLVVTGPLPEALLSVIDFILIGLPMVGLVAFVLGLINWRT